MSAQSPWRRCRCTAAAACRHCRGLGVEEVIAYGGGSLRCGLPAVHRSVVHLHAPAYVPFGAREYRLGAAHSRRVGATAADQRARCAIDVRNLDGAAEHPAGRVLAAWLTPLPERSSPVSDDRRRREPRSDPTGMWSGVLTARGGVAPVQTRMGRARRAQERARCATSTKRLRSPSHHDRMLPDGTLLAVVASVTTALGIAGIAVVLLRALV